MKKTSDKAQLANCIEHTLLSSNLSEEQISTHIKEAIDLKVKAVCIPLPWLPLAKKRLNNSNLIVVTVLDFPNGDSLLEKKLQEASVAKNFGADEVDMVMNYKALLDKNYGLVLNEICSVVKQLTPIPVKVIIETSALSQEQIAIACALVAISGAKYIKTSTGFHTHGAKANDVKLMRSLLPKNILIKASGGIKDYQTAMEMINAGANRIGASKSDLILN